MSIHNKPLAFAPEQETEQKWEPPEPRKLTFAERARAFVEEAAAFSQFLSVLVATCSPSRAFMLTQRPPSRNRLC